MSHSGPSAAEIVLSEDERAELVRRAGLPGRRRADRARIILACAEGMANAEAARELGVAVKSVSRWGRRFADRRLAGLEDDAPIGRPKAELVLAEAERAQLVRWARRAKTAQYLAMRARIVLACAEGGTNKQVAADLGVDESTVDRWRARVIGGRLDGLHDEPRPGRPPSILLERGEEVITVTLEENTEGATDWAAGTVIGSVCRRPGAAELKKFLARIDKNVPAGLEVHLVCDNLATRKTPLIQEWLARHPRFRLHFTPAGSSWINQVERWFGYLTAQKIRRGVHQSLQALEADIP